LWAVEPHGSNLSGRLIQWKSEERIHRESW